MGFDVGAFVPKDSAFDSSPLLNVLYEYYLTPRVSLRTEFGWADPSFKREGSDSLRQLPLRLDVNYNLGGGIEYFLTRNLTVKGEGRYHIIDDTRTGLDPSGFAITGGVKTYF